MSEYIISKVSESDTRANRCIDELLHAEGIRRDSNLDYTCAMYDDDFNVIATGSCFGNTLRCMAVSSAHQGEGLMNEIVSHLVELQFSRGNTHLFLYTKCNSAKFFGSLGFYEIARIEDQLVFMENKRNGFSDYLNNLKEETAKAGFDKPTEGLQTAAIVMNANPFTLGHQYLVETACQANDLVHLFVLSEDASLVPFEVRKQLVMAGTSRYKNICYHNSGPYIISNATFPSYFQKDEQSVIDGHALLDLDIFVKIAKALNINVRYVGEEPNSVVTGIYNNIMSTQLPKADIRCNIIPRKQMGSSAISASTVRQAIKDNDFTLFKNLVPTTTFAYFCTPEAKPIIEKIQKESNVIHY